MERVFILVIVLSFLSWPMAYAEEILATEDEGGYQVIQPGRWSAKLLIVHNGKIIHELVPRYLKPDKHSDLYIDLMHDDLVARRSLSQPEPFDDIVNDGKPNLIFREVLWKGNSSEIAVRVVSLEGDNVEEFSPIYGGGEVYYFDDFNKDGIFEFVNTDWERHFLYSREGFPISRYVWIFDPGHKSYYRATEMIEK